ncbi:uncharacterized protein METZ01_LOCUS182771, partial [marine metagenome]
KMKGIVMIPRMIDKSRAYHSNSLGEYIFPCPLDRIVLEFLGTDHREFAYQTQTLSDKKMALWIGEKCLYKSKNDKDLINNRLLKQKPDTIESLERFNKIKNKIGLIAKNITTWVELIEVEENQILSKTP